MGDSLRRARAPGARVGRGRSPWGRWGVGWGGGGEMVRTRGRSGEGTREDRTDRERRAGRKG